MNQKRNEDEFLVSSFQQLKPGDHLCCFYGTKEEQQSLLTSYLRQGFHRTEKILFILDEVTGDELLASLKNTEYLQDRQFKVLKVRETYLKDGTFEPDALKFLFETEINQTIREGYHALRIAGDMKWIHESPPGAERLIEYESGLNEFFCKNKALALCQYDWRLCSMHMLMNVLITHPKALVGNGVYNNSYYISPDSLLEDYNFQLVSSHEGGTDQYLGLDPLGERNSNLYRMLTLLDTCGAAAGKPADEWITKKEAVLELERCTGNQLDQDLVKIFVHKMIEKKRREVEKLMLEGGVSKEVLKKSQILDVLLNFYHKIAGKGTCYL